MKLNDYLAGLVYKTNINDIGDVEVLGITSDSRQVRKGYVFICIKGEKFDGHSVAEQMLDKKAVAVVTDHDMGLANQIIVENTRNAYAIICANHFGNPAKRLKLIGVTGTNGKTTITCLIKNMLEKLGRKAGLMGTIQNEIGDLCLPAKYTTPDPIQLHAMFARMVEAGCEYVVMETSSHALDQHRLDGLEFEIGVFTNLTHDHLDYHKTMEEYFEAKAKMVGMCKHIITNIDDSYGEVIAQRFGEGAITCSLDRNDADYTAKNIKYRQSGSKFVLVGNGFIERVTLAMPGKFSVMNGIQSMVTMLVLGYDSAETALALADCHGVTGRAEIIPTGDRGYTIIRDYAHTPDALEKITAALKELAEGRLITLFGCAGNRDRSKRPDMGEAAAKHSDFVVLTSDNPRGEDMMQIINDCKPGLDREKVKYKIIPDRYAAILWAIDNLKEGDLLLLAGKGHEDYQVLHDETIYFDEKVLVEEFLNYN